MRNVLILSLAFACIAAAFDPARIHADYQAGEFEKVIRALEAFRESGRRCRKADSIFLEKHLAVVYAAHPGTRERGRYHMLRMLDLEPEADLLDMFVGEEVDGIFEKVRRESRVRRVEPAKARSGKALRSAKGPAPRKAPTARTASGRAPGPALPAPRPAEPAARATRPAFPEPGPAPRLKPWNLEEAPVPRRAPRKAGMPRGAAESAADAARQVEVPPSAAPPPARNHPKGAGNSRPVAMPASALPAWEPARTASTGPAMGVLPSDGSTYPARKVIRSQAKPAALDLPSSRLPSVAPSAAVDPEDKENPAEGPRPPWKERRFWVGGTAVAAVLGLTAYYVGSQEWSGTASRSRTYGVAAKPNAD